MLVVSLVSFTLLKKLANTKKLYVWVGFLANIKTFIKEMGSKVGCFAGFYHHPVTTISVHTHAYCYPLFESGTKTDL